MKTKSAIAPPAADTGILHHVALQTPGFGFRTSDSDPQTQLATNPISTNLDVIF